VVRTSHDTTRNTEPAVLERISEFDSEFHSERRVVADPTAKRDDDIVRGEIDAAIEPVVIRHLDVKPRRIEREIVFDDLARSLFCCLGNLEATGDDRRSLRVELPIRVIETEDGRVLEPAEIRTLH